MCISSKEQTTQDILAYLAEHPNAQDTLEGIVEWWVLERRIRSQTAEVRNVLAELVAGQLLFEQKGRDERLHYRLNPGRLVEIKSLLRKDCDSAR